MQTSIELVRRAIEFRGPERVPYNFDENRTPVIDTKYGDDFIWVFVDPAPDFAPSTPGENELGVVSETLDEAVMGIPKQHPLDHWHKLADYHFPDYSIAERYHSMERHIAKNPDKYVLGMFPHFLFQVLYDLLGFEHFMLSVALERENMETLLDMLADSAINVVNQMADRGVHGIIAIDDMGLQDRLMISPTDWRALIKPRYARVIDVAHGRGLHIFSHICGYIPEIIDDLIEVDLDVLQIDQQDHMGIDMLADRFGGRICFFCPVDIQTTLPKPDNLIAIEDKVKQLVGRFGCYNGGFMAKTYPQPEAINIPEENMAHMCDGIKKYGHYPLNWK
ncbi:MAG: hypothetical protein GY759_10575 [Chloroflexi bacterium]|nr:hypothetical protein [Chloroflexota bacterium]